TPGWAGLGHDLPKAVFLEWVSWVMSERYMFSDPKLKTLANFPNYKGALRALCISDDPWATRPAVELLCSGFTAITPEILTVTPAGTGATKIGHFGFFRPEHRDTLWRGAAEWIEGEQRMLCFSRNSSQRRDTLHVIASQRVARMRAR